MSVAGTIVFVVDETTGQHVAREYVVSLASSLASRVHLVYVGLLSTLTTPRELSPQQRERMVGEARGVLTAEVERLAEMGLPEVSTHLRMGKQLENVLALADEVSADLIIIGDHADNKLISALVGQRPATRVARRSACSVLVAKEARS